ncbi:hypothetical protein PHSC3_001295 [Chlamydiales bacterium STE3]|nr:hypothetical protein PHSC3_001295 [Chlamydiales bacterium STE3]
MSGIDTSQYVQAEYTLKPKTNNWARGGCIVSAVAFVVFATLAALCAAGAFASIVTGIGIIAIPLTAVTLLCVGLLGISLGGYAYHRNRIYS